MNEIMAIVTWSFRGCILGIMALRRLKSSGWEEEKNVILSFGTFKLLFKNFSYSWIIEHILKCPLPLEWDHE